MRGFTVCLSIAVLILVLLLPALYTLPAQAQDDGADAGPYCTEVVSFVFTYQVELTEWYNDGNGEVLLEFNIWLGSEVDGYQENFALPITESGTLSWELDEWIGFCENLITTPIVDIMANLDLEELTVLDLILFADNEAWLEGFAILSQADWDGFFAIWET